MARDFSVIGRALSAPVRSTFLNLLIDGSRRPASELANAAGVNPSTASEHLSMLTAVGVIVCEASGRNRFYRLADASVASALEQLGTLCPEVPAIGYRQSRDARSLAHARLCYDHLAGYLGVELLDALLRQSWLGEDLTVTRHGRESLLGFGIDVSTLTGRRPMTRQCPDWTARRNHLAGRLGAALAQLFIGRDWVRPRSNGRGLDITPSGTTALSDHWQISEFALQVDMTIR